MSLCQKAKVDKVLGEFKKGQLRGRDNKVIKDRDQAVAIALSYTNKCSFDFKKIAKEKIIQFLTKKELVKIASHLGAKIDSKMTKEEIGRKIKKDDLLKFIS